MKKYISLDLISKGYLLSKLMSLPFWGIITILPIILIKEMNASVLQISTIIALKPLSAFFASYWNNFIFHKNKYIIKKLFWSYILKYLLFCSIPFINNTWLIILSYGCYMMIVKGIIPIWMEILNVNYSNKYVSKICSWGLILEYIGIALIPLLFGWVLDSYVGSWKWFFLCFSICGMIPSIYILKIPFNHTNLIQKSLNIKSHILMPWKDAILLLHKRPDFLKFQIGFFLGGAGLIIMQTVIPKYFSENLNLSYSNILIAIATCKGIGFIFSSSRWRKLFYKINLFSFCSIVTLFALIFPVFLFFAQLKIIFLFIGYVFYGIMQGGSELSWKMSGLVFSNKDDSSPYTSVNILAVGLRGLIFPYFTYGIIMLSNIYFALSLSVIFCLFATIYMFINSKSYATKPIIE